MITHGIRICKFSVLVLPLLTVAACSDDDDDLTSELGINTGLNGTWVSGCQIDEDGDGDITSYTITGNAVQIQTDTFTNDASCTTRSVQISASGTFMTGAEVPLATGAAATQVDFTLQLGSIAYFGTNVITNVNANAACNRSDWQDGVSYDATDCLGFPTTGYEIFRVDGNTLYFGDDSGDGETPETRPTGLDLTSPLTRSGS